MTEGIFPLFKKYEVEEANKFLAKNLIDKGLVQVLGTAKDVDIMRNNVSNIMTRVCAQMYGVNSPQMANFLLVQHMVDDKLRNTLFNYMKHSNINGSIIDFIPSDISQPILFKENMKPNPNIFGKWNPNELWDFSKELTPEQSLVSPLNGFLHMSLILQNVTNKNFLLYLLKNGIITGKELDDTNWQFKQLEIKLLPYNNFNKVLNIANAIFKYY